MIWEWLGDKVRLEDLAWKETYTTNLVEAFLRQSARIQGPKITASRSFRGGCASRRLLRSGFDVRKACVQAPQHEKGMLDPRTPTVWAGVQNLLKRRCRLITLITINPTTAAADACVPLANTSCWSPMWCPCSRHFSSHSWSKAHLETSYIYFSVEWGAQPLGGSTEVA